MINPISYLIVGYANNKPLAIIKRKVGTKIYSPKLEQVKTLFKLAKPKSVCLWCHTSSLGFTVEFKM